MLALPPAPVVAVAAGADRTVAVASATGASLRVVVRDAVGVARGRTLRSGVGPASDLFAATDERGRTTVVWAAPSLGGRLRARAITVDPRARMLSPAAAVPLPAGMRPVALVAGRGRALLVASVDDILQHGSWCSFGGAGFAGDKNIGAVKGARGRFGAPASIGTGDAYAGSAFARDGRALSADGAGDVDAWPGVAADRCTRWRPERLAGRGRMRSAVSLAGAGDGTIAWAGQRNAGYYTPTGDEDEPPPQPAPGALTGVAIRRGPAPAAGLGRGASPAAAAVAGQRAAFAWLDQPAPGGFGGRGRRLPSALRLQVLGGAPHSVAGMLADPASAAPPRIAAADDGTVAVLEAAGRYRLAVRHADGTIGAARDLGAVAPGNAAWVLPAGRAVYLTRATPRRITVRRLR